ncbi:MAG: hypothetical protein Q7V05_12875 [Methanoregula sp.]|nr:hypothetical protein [Methanoregula sp.]
MPAESPEKPFTCPHCRHRSEEFHYVCPECGRPFMRDFIDWRMHPRDPDLRGTWYYNPFWARVWLVLAVLGLALAGLMVIAANIPVTEKTVSGIPAMPVSSQEPDPTNDQLLPNMTANLSEKYQTCVDSCLVDAHISWSEEQCRLQYGSRSNETLHKKYSSCMDSVATDRTFCKDQCNPDMDFRRQKLGECYQDVEKEYSRNMAECNQSKENSAKYLSCKERAEFEHLDSYGVCSLQWERSAITIPTTIPPVKTPVIPAKDLNPRFSYCTRQCDNNYESQVNRCNSRYNVTGNSTLLRQLPSCLFYADMEQGDCGGICLVYESGYHEREISAITTSAIKPPVTISARPTSTPPLTPIPFSTLSLTPVVSPNTSTSSQKSSETTGSATFYFGSYPSGSTVKIDGVIQDLPTPAFYTTSPGTHIFRISHAGYYEKEFSYPYTSSGIRMTIYLHPLAIHPGSSGDRITTPEVTLRPFRSDMDNLFICYHSCGVAYDREFGSCLKKYSIENYATTGTLPTLCMNAADMNQSDCSAKCAGTTR